MKLLNHHFTFSGFSTIFLALMLVNLEKITVNIAGTMIANSVTGP